MSLTLEQGKLLVDTARKTIISRLRSETFELPEDFKNEFSEKKGIFVTIYLDDELRGCIGFPIATKPLSQAITEATNAAAFTDPRFPPLTMDELEDITIEISVLTAPIELKVRDKDQIRIGRDGLIIDGGYASGLLLPQVAVEQGWDKEEFLENVCIKAGLPTDAYLEESNKLYSFQAQIFAEINGNTIEKTNQ